MEEHPIIYTVGHSNHPIDFFIELIQEYKVDCIIDVRSVAASKYNPQFNKEDLKKSLAKVGIKYSHFEEEFGARQKDPDLLDEDGQVDFEKVRKFWLFKNGVEKLWKGVEHGLTMSLMCSEGEPLDCHRFSMIAIQLEKEGFDIKHIMKDKTLKSNADLEAQLLKKYEKKIPHPDIFNPDLTVDDQLKVAYHLKNKEIGFI
jgi:uncharacterized protein (DUF488 family)